MTALNASAASAVGPEPSRTPPRLAIGVLGGLSLALEGAPLALPNRKARALIAYLALQPVPTFPRERLAGLLWPESDDTRARSSLRTTLHELRRALLACSCRVLRDTPEAVSLSGDLFEVDLEAAFDSIAAGHLPHTIAAQPRAVALLLAGYEDLADEFRTWLEQFRADSVGRLSRALERGYSDQNLTARERRRMAEAALRLDPLDEGACRTVMRLAAEGGEIAVALRAYSELYEALGVELDMEPSDATQTLVAAIKIGGLDAAPPPRELAPGAPVAAAPRSSHAGIVVLPFVADADATANDGVRQFAEGVEEGIVHVLSGIGELFVIARGTARTFGGRNVDPREVGRALGVDYVLSGRVTASAEGLRVFTELAESSVGRVIHTDRYNTTPQGLFALQDRMADDLVGVIAPAVKAHELARAKRKAPESITAYDLMLQGVELQYALEESSFAAGGARLYEAIARDPHYAPAYAHAATWHNFRIGQGWSPRPGEDAAHAARCAAKALELDRNNAVALAIHGQVLSFNGRRYQEARDYLDRAITLGPSSVLAWTLSSATHSWTGNGAPGVEHATRAVKLSPFDPFVFFAEHMLSQSHYMQGNYDIAIDLARSVQRRNPRLTSNLRTMTAALVASGATDEARSVAKTMLSLEPSFRLTAFERRTPLCDAVRAEYVARLRHAGLPD